MASKSFNSIDGFSVSNLGNVIIDGAGNITTDSIIVAKFANLGNVANVKIAGGSSGQVLSTDGAGNLSFISQSGGNSSFIANGASNVSIPISNGNVQVVANGQTWVFDTTGNLVLPTNSSSINYANGTPYGGSGGNTSITSPMPTVINSGETYYVTANHQGLFSVPIEINGTLEVDGILVDTNTSAGGNSTQLLYKNGAQIQGVPIATYDGSNLSLGSTSTLKITGGTNGYVLQTDGTGNLTWTAQTGGGSGGVAGANTQVQFNDAGAFGGNASFTFNKTTGLLSSPYLSGDGSNLTSITGSTVTGAVPFATTANSVSGANVIGQVSNSLISGTVFANAQPNITSTGTLASLSVSGNANIGNIGTAGLITATGNVTAGNLVTGGVLSVTGNANVGNLGTSLITATGNITGANIITAGIMSSTGNATHGNISTGGLITATGNITGGNLVTGGVISVTGNANIGNIGTAGLITATGNINGGNIITGGLISATGNITVGNLNTAGTANAAILTVSGNANIGNIGTGGLVTATGNITGGNLVTGGVISVTGNANIGNIGTGGLITATGNIRGANLVTPGVLSVTGNANIGNIGTGGLITATGNLNAGNIITAGIVSATGNISGANLAVTGNANITFTPATATGTAILVTAANTIGGTGYADFLRVTNSSGGATNANKTFRMNSTGAVEIINSAYDSTIFNLDNAGTLTLAGSVIMSNRIAFRVYGSGNTLINATTTLNANNWAVDYQQGSSLNGTTGIFTAPTAGLYQVNLIARYGGSASISAILVRKTAAVGGATSTQVYLEWGGSSSAYHFGGSTIVKLAVNDTLQVIVTTGTVTFDANDCWSVAFIG